VEFTVTEHIAATRAEIQSALADPAYYASLANPTFAMRTPELLDVHEDGAVIHTRVRYAFDGTLSGPASMVVDSSKLTWVIALSYDTSSHTGSLTVIPDHYDGMLSCEATIELREEDGATTETVSGTLKVHVPLVANASEKAILGGFTRYLEMEAGAMADYCASTRDA
jgi:hypothetical protein